MSRVVIHRAGEPTPKLVLEQIGDDTLEGGVGGWETQTRPQREEMTSWRGTPATRWTIPMSLDNLEDGGSVERDIDRLIAWGQPSATAPPPVLVVNARVGRAPSTFRWVIDAIEWGAQARDDADDRIRQDVTVTFLKHVPGKILKGPAAKSRSKGGKGGKGGKDKDKGKG